MTECSLLERTLGANLSRESGAYQVPGSFSTGSVCCQDRQSGTRQATFFVGRAGTDSHYKRIRRFLRFFEISEAEVARLVIRLMKLEPPFVISIDRTEWQLRKNVGQRLNAGDSF